MEFLLLSRRRSSVRNVPGGEERGETDVFAGYFIPDLQATHEILFSGCLESVVIFKWNYEFCAYVSRDNGNRHF